MSHINVYEQNLTRQAQLLAYANTKRIEGDFNDVTIQAGAECILANRMVLACYSKFFESMFLSALKEKYQNTVEIKTFDGMAVKQIIQYIYTGILDINTNNALTLLGTADFLQVDDVKEMCFNFMETSLTVDNCLDVVKASILYNNPSLQQTYQYISDNFDEIVQGDNFKQLSKDELLSLFTNVDRNKVQEMSMYTVVIDWIKHDQNRVAEFSSLFLTLDLKKFPSEFVANTIAEEPLVKGNIECLNAVVFYYTDRERNLKTNSKATKILCVGGRCTSSVSEVYSVSGDLLNNYSNLPRDKLYDHCALKVDDFVYCLGGKSSGHLTNKVYRLNMKDPYSEWEEVASMTEKRRAFGAVLYKGYLVVAGGYDGWYYLSTAELYDLRLNRWRTFTSLAGIRCGHVLVVENEKLLAIGGWIEDERSSPTVEQLDKFDGKWEDFEPMNVGRRMFAAVACDNFIYALGGYGKNAAQKSVEKYDMTRNEWSFASSMNVERYDHAACVLNGKIYVVGGKDANDKVVKTIECYDPTTDQWTVVGETKQEWWGHAIVAV